MRSRTIFLAIVVVSLCSAVFAALLPLPNALLVGAGVGVCLGGAILLRLRGEERDLARSLQLTDAALEEMKRGTFGTTVAIPDPRLFDFGDSLNSTIRALSDRFTTLEREQRTISAVLAGMIEGVAAFDERGRAIHVNAALCSLLGIEAAHARGKRYGEILHSASLQRFYRRVLESANAVEEELEIITPRECTVLAYGRVLSDAQSSPIGVLLVLHDITQMKRLENVRKDFVSNVSHELRTPITTIKGFVETLLEGGMENPGDTKRFLEIILRHANRLNQIFDDLLSLARLEDQDAKAKISFVEKDVGGIVEGALEATHALAEKKGVFLASEGEPSLSIRCNPSLLEQALVNLIQNAIEYSEEGQTVLISFGRDSDTVILSVSDTGCGIESSHLPRLFERFYRVDSGRSRKSGGTGLGLSIVKHIAQLHGGYPHVESSLGAGSTFSLHIPIVSGTTPVGSERAA